MIKIYNTLSGKKEEFVTLEPGKVRMYVCGPTVYNYLHIGNARPMIVFDTVRRYLEYRGYEVNFVSNFTDVDDKIIAKANEEGVDTNVISERYIEICKENMQALNIKKATKNPKATEEIEPMIDMITQLINDGYAYEKNGTVFFRTRSYKEYGKLSNKKVDDLISGVRIDVDDTKEEALDFVLWKPKKDGEVFWKSPWSDGRPGWHIECSVMSKKYLGEQIDIHAGGQDLIFPHHENEIAQSEACSHKEFSRYWMHNGFITVDNRKMSKSLNNFYTINEVLEKYDGQVLRYFMLSSTYHGPINFTWEALEASKQALERIRGAYNSLIEKNSNQINKESNNEFISKLVDIKSNFEEVMDNDFNTADAITQLFELTKLCNLSINTINSDDILKAIELYDIIAEVLGFKLLVKKEILDEEIQKLIEERTKAKKDKNFKLADEIRDKLLKLGIVLEDTREGVRWKRV